MKDNQTNPITDQQISLDKIKNVTLRNIQGNTVDISTYGARITSIKVPDINGNIGEVTLGYSNNEGYLNGCEYLGATIGRFANRINKGCCCINGKKIKLPKNDNDHHLHGGDHAFSTRNWTIIHLSNQAVSLFLLSEDKDEQYPGTLKTVVTYEWTDSNELKIDYFASTDKETIVNLTNHTYFNLNGEGQENIENHTLKTNSNHILETNSDLIPTGKIIKTTNTPFDFNEEKSLSEDIDSDHQMLKNANGYDHCWIIPATHQNLKLEVATLKSPSTGRVLEVFTDLPGIQIYSGNNMDGIITGRSGKIYKHRDGICLEPGYFPDTPNHSHFPQCNINEENEYCHTIIYKFSVINTF